MNEFFHFLTGYFLAIYFWQKNIIKAEKTSYLDFEENEELHFNKKIFINLRNNFKNIYFFSMYLGIAALLPDFDSILMLEHGTITHTIIGTTILAISFGSIIYFTGKIVWKILFFNYQRFLFYTFIAAYSHLFLDIFTHQKFDPVGCITKHIYFWPIWNQSFHLDCLFGLSYSFRIICEFAIYAPILFLLLLYRWRKYKDDFFCILNYKLWQRQMENYFQALNLKKISEFELLLKTKIKYENIKILKEITIKIEVIFWFIYLILLISMLIGYIL
ncbi:MAG: hypothetical protein ACTSRZ_12740 [Promethearchaeota archaeon]